MFKDPDLEQIASSSARLKIGSLLSERPRSLQELSAKAGISVQGVLKHLARLEELGLTQWSNMEGGAYLRPRKLYSLKGKRIDGLSRERMMVARLSRQPESSPNRPKDVYNQLESLAEEIVFLKSRINEQSRKLERTLDDLAEDEAELSTTISLLGLSPEERQIAMILFTENTLKDTESILREYYGCIDPETAIGKTERALRRKERK